MFNNSNRKEKLKLFSNNPIKAAMTIVFLGSVYGLVKVSSLGERGATEPKLIKKNNQEEGK